MFYLGRLEEGAENLRLRLALGKGFDIKDGLRPTGIDACVRGTPG